MVLKEIGIKVKQPIPIREDNEATIKLGQNNMSSVRSKYIDLRHHTIRYYNNKGIIALEYVRTNDMIADIC